MCLSWYCYRQLYISAAFTHKSRKSKIWIVKFLNFVNKSWKFHLVQAKQTEAEAPILWPPDVKSWLTRKDPDARKDWGQEGKRVKEDEMVGWHLWLNGHEYKQTLGVSEGQPGVLQSTGSQRVGHILASEEQYWTSKLYLWVGIQLSKASVGFH